MYNFRWKITLETNRVNVTGNVIRASTWKIEVTGLEMAPIRFARQRRVAVNNSFVVRGVLFIDNDSGDTKTRSRSRAGRLLKMWSRYSEPVKKVDNSPRSSRRTRGISRKRYERNDKPITRRTRARTTRESRLEGKKRIRRPRSKDEQVRIRCSLLNNVLSIVSFLNR